MHAKRPVPCGAGRLVIFPERMFRMDDVTWLHHANPWSVILRFSVLPLIILAFWSRLWLGWWAVVPVSLALVWTWANPRVFQAPWSLDHWTSKGVLGERVWLNRDTVPGTNASPKDSEHIISSFRDGNALCDLGGDRV